VVEDRKSKLVVVHVAQMKSELTGHIHKEGAQGQGSGACKYENHDQMRSSYWSVEKKEETLDCVVLKNTQKEPAVKAEADRDAAMKNSFLSCFPFHKKVCTICMTCVEVTLH